MSKGGLSDRHLGGRLNGLEWLDGWRASAFAPGSGEGLFLYIGSTR